MRTVNSVGYHLNAKNFNCSWIMQVPVFLATVVLVLVLTGKVATSDLQALEVYHGSDDRLAIGMTQRSNIAAKSRFGLQNVKVAAFDVIN